MSNGEFPTDHPQPDPEANERLGAVMADLRQRAGLSQASLAERVELEEQEIAAIEAGQLEPTWGDLRRIAYALEVPLPELLARTERSD
ncbi:MAG TPA: helix-turn-helix transcriptional regulator [Solirubrobacterales bacterium]|nr:helix-turn-helix transcriptional regulator [Solirubrobacterales bacterium]